MTQAPQLHSKRLFLFRLLVLSVGTVVSVLVYFFVAGQQSEQAINEMQMVAHQRNINLTDHIVSRVSVFESLATTLKNSGNAATAFEKQGDIFLRQFSDIHSLYWAPYTPLKNIKQLKQQAANLGLKDFYIYERPPTGYSTSGNTTSSKTNPGNTDLESSENKQDIAPSMKGSTTEESFYLPTLFQRHRYQGGLLPGMDLMSSSEWRDSISQSIENKHIGSARVYTELGNEARIKLLWLFYPVYEDSAATASPPALLGMVAMTINFGDFIEDSVTILSSTPVPFEIYDTEDHSKIPLYHWPAQQVFNGTQMESTIFSNSLPLFDRELRIFNVATEEYLRRYQNFLPIWLALLSMLCTLVVYVVIKMTQRHAEQIQELSNQRCWQLEQTNKTLNNKVIEKSTFEKAHKEVQDKLNDYLNLTEDYYWELDPHLRFTYVSRKCINITGFPANSLIGSLILDNFNQEDAIGFKQALEKVVPRKKSLTIEVRCLAQRNHWRKERIHVMPVFDKNGQCSGYRGISRDIAEVLDEETALEDEVLTPTAFSGRHINAPAPSISFIHEQSATDEAYRKLIKEFVHHHQQTMDNLQQAFIKDQYPAIIQLMKTLATDALPLGADAIHKVAKMISEAAAANQSGDVIESLINTLEKHLRPMLDNLLTVSAPPS